MVLGTHAACWEVAGWRQWLNGKARVFLCAMAVLSLLLAFVQKVVELAAGVVVELAAGAVVELAVGAVVELAVGAVLQLQAAFPASCVVFSSWEPGSRK